MKVDWVGWFLRNLRAAAAVVFKTTSQASYSHNLLWVLSTALKSPLIRDLDLHLDFSKAALIQCVSNKNNPENNITELKGMKSSSYLYIRFFSLKYSTHTSVEKNPRWTLSDIEELSVSIVLLFSYNFSAQSRIKRNGS